MLVTVIVFAIGVICGLAAGMVHVRLQQKKIRLYEFYIRQRLRESLPHWDEHLETR